MEILLGWEDVDPNKPDSAGRTPLSLAAKNCYYRVVALLQSHKAVTPEQFKA